MTADITRVNQWIRSTLANDQQIATQVGTRVYTDVAPQGTTGKLILIAFLGGSDKLSLRTRQSNAIYLIRAVMQGSSYDAIEPIADRIDDVLAVPDTGTLFRDTRITGCRREQPHERKDEENGVPVVYLGGFYRILFTPLIF